MLIVPFTADYDQTFRTELDGVTYVFDARWNERGQHWAFDLTRNSDQKLLVAGVPLLSGQDVLSPYALGLGGIVVADLSNTQSDPGPDNLADTSIVVYLSPDELAILAGLGIPGIVTGVPPGPSSTASAAGSGGTSSGGSGDTIITNISQTITNLVLGGAGFSSDGFMAQEDSSGNEVLAFQWPQYVGGITDPTINVVVALLGSGSGTVRVYVGSAIGTIGDTGTPEGVLGGTATVSGLGPSRIPGTAIANPGGFVYVKITIQSAAPATLVSVGPLVGALG